jgi:hypothetical protein
MKLLASYLLFVLTACGPGVHGNPGSPPDSAAPAPDAPGAPGDAPLETQVLGMNDISMVLPETFLGGGPLGNNGFFGDLNGIDHARDLVPRELYARLVISHHDIVNDFDDFGIFAIRFDLCDRQVPGPCPEAADGSLRLVFQPVVPLIGAADVGLHAFYTIPAAELGFVVNELRAIARLSHPQADAFGPLGGTANTFGLPRLHALLDKYATSDRLIRLSVMGQDARSVAPRVVFRGLELHDGAMVDITVATVDATEQDAALTGAAPSYDVLPVADTPAGFALALSSASFSAAAPADQRGALDALVATQNPVLFTAATLQCSACHTSTYLAVDRALSAGVDSHGLPSFFTTTHDVRVSKGISATNEHSLHAFGWMAGQLAISQRVANETAVVLDEIERRFPVPTP